MVHFMENPTKMDYLGVPPIYGNPDMYLYVASSYVCILPFEATFMVSLVLNRAYT